MSEQKIVKTVEEANAVASELGFPIIVIPAFDPARATTSDEEGFEEAVTAALQQSATGEVALRATT